MSREALETLALRGDLNFEHIVVLQIQRCLNTSHIPELYSINVNHLLRMLPKAAKEAEEFKKILSEHKEKKILYMFKGTCGRPMGKEPIFGEDGEPMRDKDGLIIGSIYRNKKDDWNWDGGDPILVSPVPVDVDVTNWEDIFELCLHTCDDMGISWKKQDKGGAR